MLSLYICQMQLILFEQNFIAAKRKSQFDFHARKCRKNMKSAFIGLLVTRIFKHIQLMEVFNDRQNQGDTQNQG